MEKVVSRDILYIWAVLGLPIIMLFKGFLGYFIGGIGLSLALIMFDPLFKRFRKQVEGANKFISVVMITGLFFGALAVLNLKYFIGFAFIWCVLFTVYSMKMLRRIESK